MRVCAIEDKTAVVVVTSYRSVSRNPVHFKALVKTSTCLKILITREFNDNLPRIVFHEFCQEVFR